MTRRSLMWISLVAAALTQASLAQTTAPTDAGGRRGPRSPEEFRQRMTDQMKQLLGVTDEEWTVLQPKIDKVNTLSRDLRFSGMGTLFGMMGGGRRGGGVGGGAAPVDVTNETPMSRATRELRTVLDDKSATAEQIISKLTALREARDKAREELTKAQKELKELLTQRQEATLVMMGILE